MTSKYQPANNIQLKSESSYRRWNDTAYRRTETKPTVSISLLATQQGPVPQVVTCSPNYYSDEYVSSASMIAAGPVGDSDPSNNYSSWENWTEK